AWHGLFDPSVGIDGRSDARISGAQKPARIFDCPHPRLLQMLRVSAAVAIPAVVRDIHKNLRTIFGEPPHFVGKNGLVTDKDAQLFIACLQRSTRLPAREISNFLGQASS